MKAAVTFDSAAAGAIHGIFRRLYAGIALSFRYADLHRERRYSDMIRLRAEHPRHFRLKGPKGRLP